MTGLTRGRRKRMRRTKNKRERAMRGFDFKDATPTNGRAVQYDNFRGGVIGGWKREDFVYAVNVHQRAFGARRTQEVLYRLFGTTDPTAVPWYAYGPVIAACAEEMAQGLPHSIPRPLGSTTRRALLPPPQRKPYA
jgi:hypothetical protein